MNVFVLNTGRCGSVTFASACQHITNFSSAHESRSDVVGPAHFDYPDNHIEIDNRLSWFLGRLEDKFGDDAFYVHLQRDELATARSFARRYNSGIINVYKNEILMGAPPYSDPLDVSLDYCRTVNSNIRQFLSNKTRKMDFCLERAESDFSKFWEAVGAQGNLDDALAEFSVSHNASDKSIFAKSGHLLLQPAKKLRRIILGLPNYLRTA